MNEREPLITIIPHFKGSVVIRANEELGDVRIADEAEAHAPRPGGDELDIPEALFETGSELQTAVVDRAGLPLQLLVVGRRIDLRGTAELLSEALRAGRSVEIHLYEHESDVETG
jgi:hypothetical protein